MHARYTHTHIETQPHTRDTSNGVVHIQRLSFRSISILKRQSDRVSKQQPNRPSRQAFPNSIATQNTQATCSVRLFCHRPRHELSTDTNTPHSPQPNTDRVLRSHRTHAAGRSNRVWQVRQHRVFGARFLVSATSNTRSNTGASRQNQACVRFGCFISIGIAQQHKHLSDLASIAMIDAIVRGSGSLQTRRGRNHQHAPKRSLSSSKAPSQNSPLLDR